MKAVQQLEAIVAKAYPLLVAIPPDHVAAAPGIGKWSQKQELGHLLDSACNNHQRIVRAQLEEEPSLPGYDGDRWVELHDYQNSGWSDMVESWKVMNEQLVRAARAISPEISRRKLTVGGQPVTLEFIVNDYVRHLLHHLHHIGLEVEGT